MRILIFLIVPFSVDGCQLQRIAGDNFKVGSAFIALNDLAFFDIIHIDIQRIVTFRAYD